MFMISGCETPGGGGGTGLDFVEGAGAAQAVNKIATRIAATIYLPGRVILSYIY
jgi:hypothetical protein